MQRHLSLDHTIYGPQYSFLNFNVEDIQSLVRGNRDSGDVLSLLIKQELDVAQGLEADPRSNVVNCTINQYQFKFVVIYDT